MEFLNLEQLLSAELLGHRFYALFASGVTWCCQTVSRLSQKVEVGVLAKDILRLLLCLVRDRHRLFLEDLLLPL